jgi:nicotinic acid mononucleotide adenylyltransferase
MLISILPGSFKPPHKGHLSILEKLIKKNFFSKIIILISKKPRPLDKRFLEPEKQKKQFLINALKDYSIHLENKNLKKKDIILLIKNLIEENKIKTITAEKSLKIWKLYLKYIKQKYKDFKLPKIEFRIAATNNILLEIDKTIRESFKEKQSKIILIKSFKNKLNTRFQFLEKKFGKYIKVNILPDIKNIHATNIRNALLKNNKKTILSYFPKELNDKIYTILKK